jgi:hypothetical protein
MTKTITIILDININPRYQLYASIVLLILTMTKDSKVTIYKWV